MNKIKNIWIAFIVLLLTHICNAESLRKFFVPKKTMNHFGDMYGGQAVRRLNSLLKLMEDLTDSPEDTKVIEVNRFFNQLQYCSDLETWNKNDYWASRLEFLGKGQGDCEDFAVAKYLTLTQLGISDNKLFLTYSKAIGYPNTAHLVMSYYKEPNSIPFILDNYNKRILPASQRKDLIPVYSFTASDLYLQKMNGLGKRICKIRLNTQNNLNTISMEICTKESSQ